MLQRNEFNKLMNKLIDCIVSDTQEGISRFLQANPYSEFEYYNFDFLEDQWDFFEEALYCESELSQVNKEQICNTLKNPHGKNTFFIVGYQGCGKSTFINSVINKYNKKQETKLVVFDFDKFGDHQVDKVARSVLKNIVRSNVLKYSDFIDFYRHNIDIIDEINSSIIRQFYNLIDEYNTKNGGTNKSDIDNIIQFINDEISIKDAIYIILLWELSFDFCDEIKSKEKIMFFFDNLDCVDDYNELKAFILCIDSFTVEMSRRFRQLNLCNISPLRESFISKIKIFIAMRETTKANLPSSHFSDVFRSIYTNKDMTEWYDKGKIIEKRVHSLLNNDFNHKIKSFQNTQLNLILQVTGEIYTKKVIYPLFNNNYRSAVEMISKIIISNTEEMQLYKKLIELNHKKYKHGARGILLKKIFDQLNTGDSYDENCFKRIGVLDLLNRNRKEVSICRLILSYLSHYTETRCDSGRNSVTLREIQNAFEGTFNGQEVIKVLCEMFLLRDTIWTHLVSFNQMEYQNVYHTIVNPFDINSLDFDRTTLHYSCAGKIYIEYVATHFEFFSTRIFGTQIESLFSEKNLVIDSETGNYKCCDIINKVCEEIERCCKSLKRFNIKICNQKNYPNPYKNPYLYRNSHYVCTFKRHHNEEERRFKQFHEERLILTHINYLDSFRFYVLNGCKTLSQDEKITLNEKITEGINRYVRLLTSNTVLKNPNTYEKFCNHYNKQIEELSKDWSNFTIEISKNNTDEVDTI